MEEMTASKMLRDACDAPGGLDPRPEQMLAKLGWRLAGSCGHYTFSSSDAARSMCDLFGRLADKIDIELAEAKEKAAYLTDRPLSEVMAHHTGLYAKGAEPIGDWLDRWFIPRPRYEDGEPVRFGEDTDELDGVEKFIFLRNGGCCQMQDADGNICNVFHGKRVKRRAPEVLGADGLPLDEDDTVYGMGREQHRYTVQVPYSINEVIGQRFCVQCYDHDEGNITWCDPSMLTHTPPDTQERIDREKMVGSKEYWSCTGISCMRCPSKIDGELPSKHYGVRSCSIAQGVDIARRQRELDARTGGAE